MGNYWLAIIPARAGSKGIKDKNIQMINNKPLIAYAIEAAQQSKYIINYVVSTDSPVIAEIAVKYGAAISGLRPKHLSTDTAKSIDVIRYETEKYEQREKVIVTHIILLQPTTPFRDWQDIDRAIKIYSQSSADSLISVVSAENVHPYTMYQENNSRLKPLLGDKHGLRRQEFPKIFLRNGAIYIAKRSLIMENNQLICDAPAFYEMPRSRSFNIDEALDLKIAKLLMEADLCERTV